MNDPTTEIHKMIQELNQYILPGTLMESFDAYREEAYREALSSIPKTGKNPSSRSSIRACSP
jgi:hypothetical protein